MGKMWSIKDRTTGSIMVSCIQTFVGHTDVVYTASFSFDGLYVITGSLDHTARLWNATDGNCVFTFTGHSGAVFIARFSQEGDAVLTGSSDSVAKLWSCDSGTSTQTFVGHQGPIKAASF